MCKGEENNSCLTAPEIAGLKKVYDGAKNPRTGAQVFPGTMRGGEAGWGMWIAGTQVPPMNAQHLIMFNGLANLVFDGPKWDWKTFDFDKDVAYADNKVGGAINQINPDLSGFKKHGGKLLQYHGWNDPAISPLNSINYFESVQEKMGDTASFYRLFMIPGMEHCMGGPGTSEFDHMQVIVKWVEDGVAPERIVAQARDADAPAVRVSEGGEVHRARAARTTRRVTCARRSRFRPTLTAQTRLGWGTQSWHCRGVREL